MAQTIAVVAAGAMGAGMAARLTARGARVLTSTAGRSAASQARAAAAGMQPASDAELATADLFLSIVPPGEAVNPARRMAAAYAGSGAPATYVDCNAVSPRTAAEVASVLASTGVTVLDGGIIGLPPKAEGKGPTLYLSGPAGAAAAALSELGLTTAVLDGGIGAASALKMSYGGITKGSTALAAAMILAADRAGAGAALHAELAQSQPETLARLGKTVPDMLPKAYRWVAEMEEVAAFIGPDRPESRVYDAIAAFYAAVTADLAGEGAQARTLESFVHTPAKKDPLSS